MMSVKEYAESMNISVAEVLKKCEELGIEVSNALDDLSDDDVINLDYAMNLTLIIMMHLLSLFYYFS